MSQPDVTQIPHKNIGDMAGSGLSTGRIEALADGVFAVAMTLLVFNVHLPEPKTVFAAASNAGTIWTIINVFLFGGGQGSVLAAYVMSFALLGVYWVSHHMHFRYIRHADRYLLWINIFFLLLVSFIPFTTQLLGTYWNANSRVVSQTVVIIYSLHLLFIGAVIYLHWWYGTRTHALCGKVLEKQIIQAGTRRILVAPCACVVAIVLAFFNPGISVICYVFIPLYYIFPGHIDKPWHWWRSSMYQKK